MAYGLQVYNKFGEDVLEMDKNHLYAYQTGTTKLWRTVRLEGQYAAAAAGPPAGQYIVYAGFYTAEIDDLRTHVATSVGTYTQVSTSPVLTLVHPTLNLIDGDLVFYDTATYGLLMSYQLMLNGYTDLTPLGGFGVCETEGGNDVGYTIMSTREPVATPTEGYGLQLFDAAGGRIFDSRQDLFTIFDHFYVSAQVMQRVIENGVSVDLDLSETHTSFRIAAPNHVSFKSYTGGYRAQAMIKQVDGNTIRISHIDNGGAQTGVWRTLYQDTVIIIGR